MPQLGDKGEFGLLNGLLKDPQFDPGSTLHVALLTATPADDTTAGGMSEVSYTGYARKAVGASDFADAHATAGTKANGVDLLFGKRTDAGTAVVAKAFALVTVASGAGDLLARGMLATAVGVGIAIAADDKIYMPAHGFANDDKVVLDAETMPGGLSKDTEYFVVGSATDSFQLSATQGGAAINITSSAMVVAGKSAWLSITQNIEPLFVTGALVFSIR